MYFNYTLTSSSSDNGADSISSNIAPRTSEVSQCMQLGLVCTIVLLTCLAILRFILCTVFNGCALSVFSNQRLID